MLNLWETVVKQLYVNDTIPLPLLSDQFFLDLKPKGLEFIPNKSIFPIKKYLSPMVKSNLTIEVYLISKNA